MIQHFNNFIITIYIICWIVPTKAICSFIKSLLLLFFFFSIDNTLYLEIHCPSVKPSLIVVSESGDNLVNFNKVPIGINTMIHTRTSKCFTLFFTCYLRKNPFQENYLNNYPKKEHGPQAQEVWLAFINITQLSFYFSQSNGRNLRKDGSIFNSRPTRRSLYGSGPVWDWELSIFCCFRKITQRTTMENNMGNFNTNLFEPEIARDSLDTFAELVGCHINFIFLFPFSIYSSATHTRNFRSKYLREACHCILFTSFFKRIWSWTSLKVTHTLFFTLFFRVFSKV